MSTPEPRETPGFHVSWEDLRAVALQHAGQLLLKQEPPSLSGEQQAQLVMDLVDVGDLYISMTVTQGREMEARRVEVEQLAEDIRHRAPKMEHKRIAKLIRARDPRIDRATARRIANDILED